MSLPTPAKLDELQLLSPYIYHLGKYRYSSLSNDDREKEIEAETGESSDNSDQATSFNALETTSATHHRFNRYAFFHRRGNERNHFNNLQLKPDLTDEEKELLQTFLKALNLDFPEFMLKLHELKMSLKTFTLNLKENLSVFRIPSPKISSAFISELTSRGLLPAILLEKLYAKEEFDMQARHKESIKPRGLSSRPRP